MKCEIPKYRASPRYPLTRSSPRRKTSKPTAPLAPPQKKAECNRIRLRVWVTTQDRSTAHSNNRLSNPRIWQPPFKSPWNHKQPRVKPVTATWLSSCSKRIMPSSPQHPRCATLCPLTHKRIIITICRPQEPTPALKPSSRCKAVVLHWMDHRNFKSDLRGVRLVPTMRPVSALERPTRASNSATTQLWWAAAAVAIAPTHHSPFEDAAHRARMENRFSYNNREPQLRQEFKTMITRISIWTSSYRNRLQIIKKAASDSPSYWTIGESSASNRRPVDTTSTPPNR